MKTLCASVIVEVDSELCMHFFQKDRILATKIQEVFEKAKHQCKKDSIIKVGEDDNKIEKKMIKLFEKTDKQALRKIKNKKTPILKCLIKRELIVITGIKQNKLL